MKYFDKLLIANRGEIAIRVMRACRELGIETVAIYSDADKNALHVKYADEAFHVGDAHPSKSYLNMERILDIAKKSGAEAVHPGYGFLAENYRFAKLCLDENVIFIGPRWKTIRAMGSKIGSKQMMKDAGVPFFPVLKGAYTISMRQKRLHSRSVTRSWSRPAPAGAASGCRSFRMKKRLKMQSQPACA